jgi:Right handed beta helix region
MKLRTWTRFLLILPLLVSALSLNPTPVRALADDTVVIWCPATVTLPKRGQDGCTATFDTFGGLITHLSQLPAKKLAVAGKIWVGKAFDTSSVNDGDVYFDGLALTSMAKYPLTIQGGWNGLGTKTVDLNAYSTFAGDSLGVNNWKSSVTLKNIKVYSASTTGCAAAVCIFTTGSIKLDRMLVTDNGINGAYLDNELSASATGPVTITNSIFSTNVYNNLIVLTNGAITLKNVSASGSLSASYTGATIVNNFDSTASPVSVINGHFNSNKGDGLTILSNGSVTLTNIEAKGNSGRGTLVDNASASGTGDVLLNGNSFIDNDNAGLRVYTNGKVTANTLIAYNNGLTTPNAPGVYISAALKAVTIGNGQFKANLGHGLTVDTYGPITASSLNAIGNGGSGLWLMTAAPDSVQAVTLNQVNADYNYQAGLEIYADGKVLLKCSSAYNNHSYGLFVRGNTDPNGPAALTLQGFLAYANQGIGANPNESTLPAPPVRTACP